MRNVGDNLDIYAMDIKRTRDHGLPTYGNLYVDMQFDSLLTFAQFTSDADL